MSLKVQKRPAQQVVANATSSAPVSIPRFIGKVFRLHYETCSAFMCEAYPVRLDIGVNLTDKVFRGRGRSGQHPGKCLEAP